MSDKATLLRRVQVCSFVLDELGLFLDTHPDDKEALECYKKYAKMHKEAIEKYQEKYGPLTQSGYSYQNRWSWLDGKWPWEYGSEV